MSSTQVPRMSVVAAPEAAPRRLDRLELLRSMLLARALGQRALKLCASAPQHAAPAGRGGEAVAVGAAMALRHDDLLFAPQRFLGAHLVHGLEPAEHLARCLAVRTAARIAPARDRVRSSVGASCADDDLASFALGAALALAREPEDRVAMLLVTRTRFAAGHCDDPIRDASDRGLPLVVVVDCGTSSCGLGPAVEPVDRTDVEAVVVACLAATEGARSGSRPQVVACADPPDDDAAAPARATGGDAGASRDPLHRLGHRLTRGAYPRQRLAELRRDVLAEVASASERALAIANGDEMATAATAAMGERA